MARRKKAVRRNPILTKTRSNGSSTDYWIMWDSVRLKFPRFIDITVGDDKITARLSKMRGETSIREDEHHATVTDFEKAKRWKERALQRFFDPKLIEARVPIYFEDGGRSVDTHAGSPIHIQRMRGCEMCPKSMIPVWNRMHNPTMEKVPRYFGDIRENPSRKRRRARKNPQISGHAGDLVAVELENMERRDISVGVWAACAVAREGLRFVPVHEARPRLLLEALEDWCRSGGNVPKRSLLMPVILMAAQDCERLLYEIENAATGSLRHMREALYLMANATAACIAAAKPLLPRGATFASPTTHRRDIQFEDIGDYVVTALMDATRSTRPKGVGESSVALVLDKHLVTIARSAAQQFVAGQHHTSARKLVRGNPGGCYGRR